MRDMEKKGNEKGGKEKKLKEQAKVESAETDWISAFHRGSQRNNTRDHA